MHNEEFKAKMKDICEMKEKLTSWAMAEFDKGKEEVDTEEMGKVVDMIKDLSKVEKDCWESKYYESIVTAMEEGEEEEGEGRYGYDRYRYPSSGRFAPKGSGKRYGFPGPIEHPYAPMMDSDYMMNDDHKYRYPDNGTSNTTRGGSTSGRGGRGGKMGYTADKEGMTMQARETLETMRDIWDSADPDLRTKMKSDLKSLMNEMN